MKKNNIYIYGIGCYFMTMQEKEKMQIEGLRD